LVVFVAAAQSVAADDPTTMLWYASPAKSWAHEALPIGNGRLGAMIFGGVRRERIALNEDTVWSGERTNWNRPDANKNLPKIRELLLAGKNAEAEALVNQTFTCVGGGSRGGARGPWGCFQELGNLNITWASDDRIDPAESVEVQDDHHAGHHRPPPAVAGGEPPGRRGCRRLTSTTANGWTTSSPTARRARAPAGSTTTRKR
jgi:hypothetical protein